MALGDIWNVLTGGAAADAATQAAAQQSAAEQKAIAAQRAAGTTAQGDYYAASQGFNPYIQGGGDAYNLLLGSYGLGGPGSQQAFTQAYQGMPGYQSGLDTGLQAATRGIAASGHGLDSGGALKALYRYGSDYENQRANETRQGLMGLGGQGFQATGAQAGLQGQGINANLGAQGLAYQGAFKNAGTIPQGGIAAANAQAAGYGNLLNAGASVLGSTLGGGSFGKLFSGFGGGNPQAAGTVGSNFAGPVNPFV